jgi:hypothetical protein
MEAMPFIISLIFRIFGAWYCSGKAEKLNRSTGGWGFFGFLLPLLAIIWIQFMKPVMEWDKNINASNDHLSKNA